MEKPKLCLACYQSIIEAGYRVEKRGGHESWIPTTEQIKYIKENWDKLYSKEIATHCGVGKNVIAQYAKRVGLPLKFVSYKRYHAEWVEAYGEGATIKEIAGLYSVARGTVKIALVRNGVKIRKPGLWSTKPKI